MEIRQIASLVKLATTGSILAVVVGGKGHGRGKIERFAESSEGTSATAR